MCACVCVKCLVHRVDGTTWGAELSRTHEGCVLSAMELEQKSNELQEVKWVASPVGGCGKQRSAKYISLEHRIIAHTFVLCAREQSA